MKKYLFIWFKNYMFFANDYYVFVILVRMFVHFFS